MPCKTDRCVCALKNFIIVVHVDDVLIFSPKKFWIDLFIKSLMDGCEDFDLTDEVSIDKCLDVEITKYRDGTCQLK